MVMMNRDLRPPMSKDEQRAALVKQRLSPLQGQLDSWKSPQAMAAEKFTPKSQAATGPLQEFESVRQAMGSRANAAKQGNLEAMQRRFAATGSLNSGAAIKSQQVASEASDRAAADQMSGVDMQEATERQRRNELGAAQDMQREDAVNQRNFQREMTNASMAMQDKMSKFDAQSKLSQLDLQMNESEFNKAAERRKAGTTGGLLGGGGFLGLGIGAGDVDL